MDYDATIIGGGLGGLVCGLLLARQGLRVAIFEKQGRVGGCCTSFGRKGFNFDLSVQSVGGCCAGGRVWRLLGELGLRDQVEFIPLEPAREYHFPDHRVLQHADLDTHVEYLSHIFPQEAEGIAEIYRIYRGLYEEMDRLPHSLPWFDPDGFAKEFPLTFRYRAETLKGVLDAHIHDKRLKAILGARSSYALLPPSRLSIVAMASLEMSYLDGGVGVLKGRMEELPRILAEGFKREGGKIFTRNEVKRIRVANGRVKGVELKGGEGISASVVVSNADARVTFLRMVGEDLLPTAWTQRLKRMQPSYSYFIVYLGVNGEPGVRYPNNEVFSSYDLEEEYAYLMHGGIHPLPSYYLLAPSLANPSHAPEGCSTICLSYKAPYHLAGGWGAEAREKLANRLISQAEGLIPGLRRRIILKAIATPLTIERMTGNRWGAAYGWAQLPRQAGIYRLSRVTPIDGLYLTGHWTSPGGGVAAAMASGEITAKLISQRFKEGR